MSSPFTVGMTHEKVLKTGPEHSAQNFFPQLPDVFAPKLGPGEQSVGIAMNLKHMAPTPLGMEVKARTEVTAVDGRKLTFKVEAFDEKEIIGEAVHERFIINAEKFNQKVESKKN
jgi:fluoroacetyl-CoA thioesterase